MLLKIGYLALSLVITVLFTLIAKRAIDNSVDDKSARKSKLFTIIIGMLVWQGYILGLGASGFLANYSLPPRFPVFLIFPVFAFTGIFLFKNRKKKWIGEIPQQWLIYFQSFRILVETLFVFSVAAGVLHENVTIEGYNFDMILGLSAPVIAFLAYGIKVLPKKIVLAWNILGLGILASVIFLFITTIYFPQFWGSDVALMPLEFAAGPYLLVAGFLMPSAVFVHFLSIVQLTRKEG